VKSLIPSKRQWKTWSLPSKLTALGALVGIISISLYLIEKGVGIFDDPNPKNPVVKDVLMVLEFNNPYSEILSIYARGDAYYWYPGSDAVHEVQAFEIKYDESNNEVGGKIEIPPKTSKRFVAKLLPKNRINYLIEQGHTGISLFIKGSNINSQFSETIAFTKSNIKGKYLPINLRKNDTGKIPGVDNEKVTRDFLRTKYLLQSDNSLELFEGQLTVTLASHVKYSNDSISLRVSSINEKSKLYKDVKIGQKIFHEGYEITFMTTERNISSYDVLLRIIKTKEHNQANSADAKSRAAD